MANDLDISSDLVHKLVRSHPGLCLLSADEQTIIPTSELDVIQEKLGESLSSGLHAKADFVTKYDVCPKSLNGLLADLKQETVEIDDSVCNKSYKDEIFSSIKNRVKRAIDEMQ